MPSVETKLWLALKSRIDTLATSPTLTKVEPGEIFEPSGPFMLISDARNDVARIGIDTDLQTRSGTLLLQVRWPVSTPITHAQLVEIAGAIAAHFPADLSMSYGGVCVRVTQDATVLQPDRDGAWRFVTVRVLWSTM